MECEHCGQVSDWIGDQSDWEGVAGASSGGAVVTRGLYECQECGHRQHAR